ncbi:MAG: hypothetical protein KGL59_00540 [Acidobacteriota bacterium]|nr:hypothetical protein [Acidobacteriota bacterium]
MTRCRIACLLLATWVLTAVPAARAQTQPLPARLPADTVLYLYSRGTDSIAPASANPLARLWSDPGFAPARRLIEQAFFDSVARNPRLARIPQRDLDALLARPAVFGIRLTEQPAPKSEGQSTGRGFLVVEAGAKIAAQVRAVLVSADPKAAGHMRITPSGYLVFSQDPATLAELAKRFGSATSAASSSLASLAAYRDSLAELAGSPTLEFFLRVPAMAMLHPQTQPGFDTGAFLRTLHLERVHLLCGSLDLNAPASLGHFAILGDTAPGSLFDFFGPDTASFSTLEAAPASASYVVNRLDIGAVLSIIVDAFSAALPPDQSARLKMISGLLSTAIVPALGGEYAAITPHPGPGRDQLYAMTVHSQQASELFESTLAPFVEPAGSDGTIRYFRFPRKPPEQAPAKTDDPPGAQSASGSARKPVPSFIALTPHLLLMSHDEALVRQVAHEVTSSAPPPGLSAVPEFRAARAAMPAQLLSFFYMNLQGIDWTKRLEQAAASAAREKKDPRAAARIAALAKWAREGGSAVLARHLHLFVVGGWKDAQGVHWRGDIH